MIDTEDMIRLLVEITTGKVSEIPDTVELAAMRTQLKKECDEITAQGGSVDIPHEIL